MVIQIRDRNLKKTRRQYIERFESRSCARCGKSRGHEHDVVRLVLQMWGVSAWHSKATIHVGRWYEHCRSCGEGLPLTLNLKSDRGKTLQIYAPYQVRQRASVDKLVDAVRTITLEGNEIVTAFYLKYRGPFKHSAVVSLGMSTSHDGVAKRDQEFSLGVNNT